MLRRVTRTAERLARQLGRAQVDQAASLARALTALVGQDTAVEPLPGGPAIATRAVLTDRVMRGQDPIPWPSAVMRQRDPDDAAFLPPLGLHPVLAGRDRTLLGLPGGGSDSRTLWVDPLGWAGVDQGPSVCAWFGLEEGAWPVGRRPDEHGSVAEVSVHQEWSDERVGVRTVCTRGPLTLTLMHFPVRLQGEVAWTLYAKLDLAGDAPRAARLALAIRPATIEGAAPLFHLTRDGDGLWAADGVPILALSRPGDGLLTGRWGQPDPWHRFSGQAGAPGLTHLGRVDVRCRVGQASAAEVWTPTLTPGQSWSRLAVIAPPLGTPAALVRTSGPSLWSGATADRRGLLRAGCEIRLAAHQLAFDSARLRLLMDPARPDLAAFLGAVGLARMGFVRRAQDRVAGWLERVRRDGRLPGAEGEETAALAWTAAEVARWTGNRGWVAEVLPQWRRLLERLASDDPSEPGGAGLLGQGGSARWTRIWRAAALLSSAAALREHDADHTRWAIAGGRRREAMAGALGPAPWTVADGRASDGAAAALMAACWLGVLPADHPAARATGAAIQARHWHGGGVLHQGGAHLAATALLLAVLGRDDPAVDAVGTVARLASPTGALPTARHPARGALGDGDDLLSAALFVLLVLDRVQVGRGRLRVLPGISFARDLPTPLGRIDLDTDADGALRVTGRWRSLSPEVVVG